MATPLFSVVVPTYNRAALLPRALDSIRRQTFRDLELLVVDDGSTDGTADLLRARYPEVQVIRLATNGGIPVARNTALAAARGRLVAFLDADDEWHANYLEHHRGVHARHTDLLFSFTDYISRGEHYTGPVSQVERVSGVPDLIGHMLVRPFIHTMSCVVVPRQEAIDCGGFDMGLKRFSDIDFYLRLMAGPDWRERPSFSYRHIAYHRRPMVTKHIHLDGRDLQTLQADWGHYKERFIDSFFSSELGQRYAFLRDRCVAGLKRGQEEFFGNFKPPT